MSTLDIITYHSRKTHKHDDDESEDGEADASSLSETIVEDLSDGLRNRTSKDIGGFTLCKSRYNSSNIDRRGSTMQKQSTMLKRKPAT
jgi:hypothetical protein